MERSQYGTGRVLFSDALELQVIFVECSMHQVVYHIPIAKRYQSSSRRRRLRCTRSKGFGVDYPLKLNGNCYE